MFNLKNKKAYITGGSGGIGRAVAELMIANGAQVAIADINDPSTVAAEIGAIPLQCDVADESNVQRSLADAEKALGKLDIVVLNAGIGDVGPEIGELDQSLLERVTRINYWGVLYGMKHAPTVMADGGSIICTSSMAAFINLPGGAAYSASKRAIISLAEMAALELGHRNIRVNCVCPGYTDTAMGSGDEGRKICEAFTALGRVANVDDISGVFLFLASDASRYMTGQALKVDGGWVCGPTTNLLEMVTGAAHSPS
ncbi:SDR family oxidoreductase [Halieaceae bacterium IMCC8485]|jgi:NAD(P)-dependent dehydrogenase (short-subunit alcohol dehydrogenase family)|uniref:SDR family oxidoreductase n=1 Tax=Candidatus Seongchinamella marina TaxID=2518990 RepID=A0ABT3SPZ6_9GAMM|nr:SDR family oxidoreductase [Candidatus Seongchinamella marina]MCX2972067.1 SDR family oxidoreductase [Candidatus Seongchinamella marina]